MTENTNSPTLYRTNLCCECFITNCTFEWALLCVAAIMNLKC